MNSETLQAADALAIYPEACPAPVDFTVDGCRDAAVVNLGDTVLQSLGRIVQVDAVIKNVCPGKRVAAAIVLWEVDAAGQEQPRGMKTILVPAQTGDVCQDITIKCVPFVVPETLDPTGTADGICNQRTFKVRVLANYVDTEFVCCTTDEAIL